MKILSIETSCDETGIAIIACNKGSKEITLLGNALASQIDIHAKFGGVFPALAKRAHAVKFVPLLTNALDEAHMLHEKHTDIDMELLNRLCEKDEILKETLTAFLSSHDIPDIDAVAVTSGPGLEPALWVGITAAKVLASIWHKPLLPINHMEGHVITALVEQKQKNLFLLPEINYPTLALLVSGGHTELVYMKENGVYKKIGQTRDDAVGEAFDKVARMLGLPYPGGPAVSKLAAAFRSSGNTQLFSLPRPMIHSKDYDFSFSGIKTAVLYTIRDHGTLSQEDTMALAAAFEDAVVEVLVKKTMAAAVEHHIQTIAVGGGVAGNTHLREKLQKAVLELPGITLHFPEGWLATDNAVMIALAAAVRVLDGKYEAVPVDSLKANGNLSIANT
jgi:N6-L-threonylcarbamoyladenine synthase